MLTLRTAKKCANDGGFFCSKSHPDRNVKNILDALLSHGREIQRQVVRGWALRKTTIRSVNGDLESTEGTIHSQFTAWIPSPSPSTLRVPPTFNDGQHWRVTISNLSPPRVNVSLQIER